MKKINGLFILFISLAIQAQQVHTVNGILQGVKEESGIWSFKGIPYAQPPLGELRWKEPQSPKNWTGTRKADHFAPQAMQRYIYSDMVFRSNGTSEDCLYLNVWAPAKAASKKLPVLVYFYGGGFTAGDGSEPRYDGESMAKKGIVAVTINYRLGIFGFLAHPELTKESPHHASGNYAFLDQHAALVWVQKNIAAFGGDPAKVTIAGESAGAGSVCAQMASPLSKGLFIRAIAESGSVFGTSPTPSLTVAEQRGVQFGATAGANSLSELRKLSADRLLELTANTRFPVAVDGYFFPESPLTIFATGKQMDIPLLAGWNSAEVTYHSLLGKDTPTLDSYKKAVQKAYGEKAAEVLKLYVANTDAEVPQVATDLASDRFISYITWKFIDLHGKTNGYPVYRYLFTRKRPPMVSDTTSDNKSLGAAHASEIEYALGNLRYNKVYAWTPDDYKVSETMLTYFANFIKSGNPNGEGLPIWYGLQSSIPKVMIIDVNSQSQPEKNLKRYQWLDSFINP